MQNQTDIAAWVVSGRAREGVAAALYYSRAGALHARAGAA